MEWVTVWRMTIGLLAISLGMLSLILGAWIWSLIRQVKRQEAIIQGLLDRVMAGNYNLYAQVEARRLENQGIGTTPEGGIYDQERGIPVD